MKSILIMVMLATAISATGCASRRATAPEARSANAASPAQGTASRTDAAVNTYAVSPMPAAGKQATTGGTAVPFTRPADPALAIAPGTIEKVPFQIGTSSVTVERLAMAAGCTGGKGAGLVTGKGPVEVYRMQCDNGKVFLAKCELRQCSPMRW